MKTILIAAVPAAVAVIANALGSMARMMTANTLEEAFEAAVAGVDLVIAGTYFDNSRMFDLLHKLKSHDLTRNIPVLCVRGVSSPQVLGSQTSQPMFSSPYVVSSASKALGAVEFVDLCARHQAIGTDRADAELRETVSRLL
jgi:response regulator RpfG family c-di-GMP phosphodiesterase